MMPECLYEFYTNQFAQFHLSDYDERRWLPIGIKERVDSETSMTAASSVTRLSRYKHSKTTPINITVSAKQ